MKEIIRLKLEFNQSGKFYNSKLISPLPSNVYNFLISDIVELCYWFDLKKDDNGIYNTEDLKYDVNKLINDVCSHPEFIEVDINYQVKTPLNGKRYIKVNIILGVSDQDNEYFKKLMNGDEILT